MNCRYNGITKIPISAIHLVKKYSTSNFLKFGHNRLRCRYITVFFRRAIMAVADKNIVFFIHTAVYSSNKPFVYKRFGKPCRQSTFLQIYKIYSNYTPQHYHTMRLHSRKHLPQPIITPSYPFRTLLSFSGQETRTPSITLNSPMCQCVNVLIRKSI